MYFDVSLSIDGVRETGKLRDPAEIRDKVLADIPSTGRLADIFEFLVMRKQLSQVHKEIGLRQ